MEYERYYALEDSHIHVETNNEKLLGWFGSFLDHFVPYTITAPNPFVDLDAVVSLRRTEAQDDNIVDLLGFEPHLASLPIHRFRWFDYSTDVRTIISAPTRTIYRIETTGDILVIDRKESLVILESTFETRNSYMSAVMIVFCVLIERLRGREWLVMHAGGLDCEGKGIVVGGASGAGKSTLLLSLLFNGAGRLVNNDRILMKVIDGKVIMIPGRVSSLRVGLGFLAQHEDLSSLYITPRDPHSHPPRFAPDTAWWKVTGVRRSTIPHKLDITPTELVALSGEEFCRRTEVNLWIFPSFQPNFPVPVVRAMHQKELGGRIAALLETEIERPVVDFFDRERNPSTRTYEQRLITESAMAAKGCEVVFGPCLGDYLPAVWKNIDLLLREMV